MQSAMPTNQTTSLGLESGMGRNEYSFFHFCSCLSISPGQAESRQ